MPRARVVQAKGLAQNAPFHMAGMAAALSTKPVVLTRSSIRKEATLMARVSFLVTAATVMNSETE